MAKLLKNAKRGLRQSSENLIARVSNSSSPWLSQKVGPALCYVDMLVFDYGVTRAIYNNRHQISAETWRSAQPAPHHIGWLAGRGIKTIVNLRGEQTLGTRWLQERACARHGIELIDFKIRSRAAPSREELLAMRDLVGRLTFPVLVHCKSGADRAGLMSVILRHVHEGVPIDVARRQLSLRYGHIRQADTGVLDAVFDRYIDDNARKPISFWDWVETVYDPDAVSQSFKARGWARRLVDDVLRRE